MREVREDDEALTVKGPPSDAAFLSTAEFGRRVGISGTTAWRTCQRNPGFAIRAGGTYRIPLGHVERLERGERPEAIAADARSLLAAPA